MMSDLSQNNIPINLQKNLLEVVTTLSVEQAKTVLEFALFLQAQVANPAASPVQKLEDLWGDFWPEDESVDDFVDSVRQWRDQDVALHQELT